MNKVSAGTIARTLILGLALLNQILTVTGHGIINVSDDEINTLISTAFTVITSVITWWKNNSFTSAAIEADKVKEQLKGGDGCDDD